MTHLITRSTSLIVLLAVFFVSILNIACDKEDELVPAGKLIESFRAEGLPIVATNLDSLTNTYTLTIPADANPADLLLKPILASGVTLSPNPEDVRDYSQAVSFELKKKRAAPQTIYVKIAKLEVGSNARCLLTRIESMDHPDEYFTFEYSPGGFISTIRTSLLFSDWGTMELKYASGGVALCEKKDSHYGFSPRQTICQYNSSGRLEKVMLMDWTDWVDWLGLGYMTVDEHNYYTGQPGNMVYTYENGVMTKIAFKDATTEEWGTVSLEYDGKRHFLSGGPTPGMLNYFLFMLGGENFKNSERIMLNFHLLSFRQNILRFLADGQPSEALQYTYNQQGFPITNETERLRFYYSNCD